jgi:hypothetical protein
MHNMFRPYRRGAVLVAAVGLMLTAACGDDDTETDADGGEAATQPPSTAADGDPCTLLDDDDLATLFADDIPDPAGTAMGDGFAECEWEVSEEGAAVLVSVLPAADFERDYTAQLNLTGELDELGDGGVSFPGFVGIGRASSAGGSVGFALDDSAAIVAVRDTGEVVSDTATARQLAIALADRL